jgi:hypothetical protein
MNTPSQQVEQVARAFYEATDNHLSWDDASESIRAKFRLFAREAIALLDESKEAESHWAQDSAFQNQIQVSN